MSVEVLAGSEEAYYGYLAVVNSIDIKNGITIDIGGGSTEITLFENQQLKSTHSFPFGAVTLTKKYIKGKKPTKKEMKRLRAHVFKQFSKLPWLNEASYPVIGIGGSARNLTRIYQREKDPTLSTIHQVEIEDKDIHSISTHLRSLSFSKRKKINGLSKDRADIIIAGIEAIYQLMQVVQAPVFMMSEKGLRAGVCYANQTCRIERSK